VLPANSAAPPASSASAEARLLFRPASAFRELLVDPGHQSWLRRPAMLLLVLGCALSLLIAGRITVRLVADGAVSFAFVPIVELAALAVVFRAGRSPGIPFRRAADLFFAGNGPWLLWLVAVAALSVALPPQTFVRRVDRILLSALLPVVWSMVIDFQFSRTVLQRTTPRAIGDLVLLRAIAWPAALAYYGGIGMWTQVLPTFFPRLFS
jgi:hypothetical protein